MSNADLLEFSGYFFACWVSGFGAGFLITAFKKFSEHI